MIRCELIFEDWAKDGKSIYSTPLGVELSLGDLHSGTIFKAEISLPLDIEHEINEAFAKHGAHPVFRLLPNAKSQATDAALSRQVACTDGLGVAVPPAPTFEQGEKA